MTHKKIARKKFYLAAMLAIFSPLALAGTTVSATQMPSGGQIIGLSAGTLVNGSTTPDISSLPNDSNIELSTSSQNHNVYAVIRWNQGFDIGSQAELSFGTSGLTEHSGYVLNIDGSSNPSQINGTLNASANTSVFVANGNGIIVGNNAVIQAPGGIALLGESMNNSTAVDDFIGENGSGQPYLDFGSVYPGNVNIDSGAKIEGGTNGVLVAGASIVNIGTIASNNVTVLAGWAPQKGTGTIEGVSSTPVYRVGYLTSVLENTPYSDQDLSPIPGSSDTFTNVGTITANQNDYSNEISLLSQGGMALYGTVTASDQNDTGYFVDNNGVEIDNNNNNISIYGQVSGIGSRYGNLLGGGVYNYEPSVWVNNNNGNIVFGQNGNVSGSVTYLSAPSIQGYYQADNVNANDLYLNVLDNINASGNPTPNNYLGNGFGVSPYTANAPVNVTLTADAEGQTHGNIVNIAINGSGIVNSGDTRSAVAEAIQYVDTSNSYGNDYLNVNNEGNYTAPPSGSTTGDNVSNTNDGGSLIIQASSQLTVTAPTQGYLKNTNANNNGNFASGNNYGDGGAFVFGGGVVFMGNDGLTVNAPIINAWSNGDSPFQGVFLQGSQIDFNNNAYIVTGYKQFVNFSMTPGTMPAISQFAYGSTFDSPSAVGAAFGSGAFINSYSTILQGVLAGNSLDSVVNQTPIS